MVLLASPSMLNFLRFVSAEGSDCSITLMIGGPPPVVECGAGLECSRDTRTCVPVEVAEE